MVVKQRIYNLKIYGITGDCPALKKILNFIGHGGYDCCWFCYIHGQYINGKLQYCYEQQVILRNARQYLFESNEAHRTQTRVNGHLGKSILQHVIDIPLPHSILIDYSHATLLGHVKSIVLNVYHRLKPFQRSTLDNQLKRQKFPHFFNRKLRPIGEFANVKSTELRNLFFYALLPNLQALLPVDMLAHLALYVCSVRLLHGSSLFGDQTSEISKVLFSKFYEDHENFYTGIYIIFKTL